MNDLASDGPGTSAGWNQTFQALTKYHDEAYHLLDEAIILDHENKENAVSTVFIASSQEVLSLIM